MGDIVVTAAHGQLSRFVASSRQAGKLVSTEAMFVMAAGVEDTVASS